MKAHTHTHTLSTAYQLISSLEDSSERLAAGGAVGCGTGSAAAITGRRPAGGPGCAVNLDFATSLELLRTQLYPHYYLNLVPRPSRGSVSLASGI